MYYSHDALLVIKCSGTQIERFTVETAEAPQGGKNQLKQQYLIALPPDFDKQTAIATAQKLNIPPKTAECYLKQWCLSGQLNHTSHGKYAKP